MRGIILILHFCRQASRAGAVAPASLGYATEYECKVKYALRYKESLKQPNKTIWYFNESNRMKKYI